MEKNSITSGEIFMIYRVWFVNLPLILGIKSLNFKDKIFSSLSRINLQINKDLETGKLADKSLCCVFSAFACLSITNFL